MNVNINNHTLRIECPTVMKQKALEREFSNLILFASLLQRKQTKIKTNCDLCLILLKHLTNFRFFKQDKLIKGQHRPVSMKNIKFKTSSTYTGNQIDLPIYQIYLLWYKMSEYTLTTKSKQAHLHHSATFLNINILCIYVLILQEAT